MAEAEELAMMEQQEMLKMEEAEMAQGEMAKADPPPGLQMSAYAPQIRRVAVNKKYIGKIIGKGGEQIKAICEETGIDGIDINDEGQCTLTGSHGCDMDRAEEIIAALTVEPVIGKTYRGAKVVKVLEFGAFVEILPGVEAPGHASSTLRSTLRR